MLRVERVPSGIPGLDDMISGGIPKGRVVLIVGGPGTGKTIMSAQFLVAGIKKHNETGLFITLDESREHLIRELGALGWDIPALEKGGKWAFTDISPIQKTEGKTKPGRLTVGKREFSLASAIENVKAGVRSVGAKRLALDPITSLVFQYPDIIQRRSVILELVGALSSTGATTVITTELRASGLERSVQLEEYLAHGVILLQTLQVGKAVTRVMQVEKMRETAIDPQLRPYRITDNGIEVYSKESVF